MKKALMAAATLLAFAGVGYGATFHGSVMDSACAKSGAHNPQMGNAKACTEACVKNGSTYVLYDASTKMTYQLDDQAKVAQFAGEMVTISGKLDASTKTIQVAEVKAGS
jgi:hypothetical protein